MDNIIKDIIEADRDARERVRSMESKREQLSTELKEQRVKITKMLEEEATEKKAEFKAQLDADLNAHIEANDGSYEETLQLLNEQFQKQKDTWVNEIYHHCLEKA